MAISVSVVVAVATEAYDRPVLSASYAIPVSALSYISLVVDARVDSTGRFKLIRDTSVVLDDAVISFGKALATSTLGTSDTQTLEFGKALSDSVSFTEVFTALIIFVREFADTAGTSDSSAIETIKALGDSTGTTENYVLSLNKLIRDGVAMNDSFDATDGSQFAFTKSVMNMAFIAEELVKTLERPLADSVEPTEAHTYTLGKLLAHSVSTQEALAFEVGLGKADTASVADQPFKSFTRAPFSDSSLIFDVITLQPSKHLTDNIDTGDTGSLRSQGYADFSYFAEDYVGDSRTF
jgi:hypothetical protein